MIENMRIASKVFIREKSENLSAQKKIVQKLRHEMKVIDQISCGHYLRKTALIEFFLSLWRWRIDVSWALFFVHILL